MGLEGIVSKRLRSRYVSGRTRDWVEEPGGSGGAARGGGRLGEEIKKPRHWRRRGRRF
jgi:hypothetical protein